jgi:hypothetical protein
MRSLIALSLVAGLATGPSFAQYGAKAPEAPPATESKPATPPASTTQTGAAMTEMHAKARIEAHGFTNVSQLEKDAKGVWNATAMKDGKSVHLSLDTQGRVTQHN